MLYVGSDSDQASIMARRVLKAYNDSRSIDELVDFLMKCSSSTRMLIRDMSFEAAREFKLSRILAGRGDGVSILFVMKSSLNRASNMRFLLFP